MQPDDGSRIQLNAWCDAPVSGTLTHNWRKWALASRGAGPSGFLRPPKPPRYQDYTDPEVGWGLVVPDDDSVAAADKAVGADLPASLLSLLHYRRGTVLRYRPENSLDYLRRYATDGTAYDVRVAAPERGVCEYRIPHYLLLYGDPTEIPWELQFHLNLSFAVGRMHLRGRTLASYVQALTRSSLADDHAAVIWATDHGLDDITSLLFHAVAEPLFDALRSDSDLRDGTTLIHGQSGSRATLDTLVTALASHKPGLIVTTSHGAIPMDPVSFGPRLGLPVDDDYSTIDPAVLLARWQPAGAVWYAHACCSAGSNRGSSFDGLLAEGSTAAEAFALLKGHAATVAPLATALLSAASPARAFIGHVEPTFDLTIRDPETGQALTAGLVDAFYRNLYQPFPIGHCLRSWYAQGGVYLDRHASSVRAVKRGYQDASDRALLSGIAAADHRSLVLLGDPAAVLDAASPMQTHTQV